MAKSVSLKTAYGSYSISFALANNVLNVIRKNKRNEGQFSKNEYEKIQQYFDAIYKADKAKVVLIKKE